MQVSIYSYPITEFFFLFIIIIVIILHISQVIPNKYLVINFMGCVTVIAVRVTLDIPLMPARFLPVSGRSAQGKVISKLQDSMRSSELIYQRGDLLKIHIFLAQLDWNRKALCSVSYDILVKCLMN